VGYWSFDEGSGTRISDRSGKSNHGSLKGFRAGSGWCEGIVGSGLKFDGTDDRVLIPDRNTGLDVSQTFTISAWLDAMPDGARPFVPMVVLSKGDPTKPEGALSVYYNEPSRSVDDVFAPANFYVSMRNADDTASDPERNYRIQFWPCAIRDRWYHFTFVFDGRGEKPVSRIYADGIEVNRKEYTAGEGESLLQALKTNDAPLEIGGLVGGSPFCGRIDELKIWDRALAAPEIQAEFRRAGPAPGPVLELFANFHSIGVTVRFSPASDPEDDATADLAYRKRGRLRYRKGFPLSRVLSTSTEYGNGGVSTRYVGSIFWAEQDKRYDVKVTLRDPTTQDRGSLNGVALKGTIRTRAEKDIATPAPAKEYYVSPWGTGKEFSREQPGSLLDGLEKARAGDHVILRGGTYYVGDTSVPRSGAPGKPIVVRGAPDEEAIMDGSAPGALQGWSLHAGTTYELDKPVDQKLTTSRLVVADGRRLYQYYSLKGLQALKFSGKYYKGTEPGPGFFIDDATRILYVNLGGEDPRRKEMRISRCHHALKLSKVDYVHVENLTFRYYNLEPRIGPEVIRRLAVPLWRWQNYNVQKLSSYTGPPNTTPTTIWYDYDFPKALFVLNSSHCVVRNCQFRTNKVGVCVMGRSCRTVIEDNEFSDTTGELGFSRMKATRTELGCGVHVHSPYSGRGLVVRRNTTIGSGDGGQATGYNASPLNLAGQTDETDVYDNLFCNSADDSLEVDGIACNVRIWGNTFKDGLTGISLSPTRHGPVYVIRNTAYDTKARTESVQPMIRMVKILSYGRRGPMFFFHNTSYANAGFDAIGRGFDRITWDLLHTRNNLFYSRRARAFDVDLSNNAGGPTSMDYDNYFAERGPTMGTWNAEAVKDIAELAEASGQEQHGLSEDPQFVDPEKEDFRLRPDSPIIDRGVVVPGINDCGPHKYKGKAPDIGAIERR